ncbi:MAG: hypothetical protein Q8L27_00425 [archaeon]|nr:hypothetical protein [archaeon]
MTPPKYTKEGLPIPTADNIESLASYFLQKPREGKRVGLEMARDQVALTCFLLGCMEGEEHTEAEKQAFKLGAIITYEALRMQGDANALQQILSVSGPLFQFGPRSKLYGRRILTPFDRLVIASDPEAGQTLEWIFCYKNKVPTRKEEPLLYKGANVEGPSDEKTLSYRGLDEVIMLLTIEADERFRKEHPEVVAKHELFKIGASNLP